MGSTGRHSTWFSEQVKVLQMSVLAFSRFPGDHAALNRAILSFAALTAMQNKIWSIKWGEKMNILTTPFYVSVDPKHTCRLKYKTTIMTLTQFRWCGTKWPTVWETNPLLLLKTNLFKNIFVHTNHSSMRANLILHQDHPSLKSSFARFWGYS